MKASDLEIIDNVKSHILIIRGRQVMIDRDLALFYGVETRVLNQAVKRNVERFPAQFCFQLEGDEFENWRSQFVTSNADKMGLRRAPYAFTEQGVAMLSAVLRSETAVKISVHIMDAFVEMRHFLRNNEQIFSRLSLAETKLIEHDKKFESILTALEQRNKEPKQGIYFQGQIYDAYAFALSLIKKAQKEIILIDGYVDSTVLDMLSKKRKLVSVSIYTRANATLTSVDIQKFNAQYPSLTIGHTNTMHDRFIIIDHKILYHLGASLKDLGKKCFAFDEMNDSELLIPVLIKNL